MHYLFRLHTTTCIHLSTFGHRQHAHTHQLRIYKYICRYVCCAFRFYCIYTFIAYFYSAQHLCLIFAGFICKFIHFWSLRSVRCLFCTFYLFVCLFACVCVLQILMRIFLNRLLFLTFFILNSSENFFINNKYLFAISS